MQLNVGKDEDGVWSWWTVNLFIPINLHSLLITHTACGGGRDEP